MNTHHDDSFHHESFESAPHRGGRRTGGPRGFRPRFPGGTFEAFAESFPGAFAGGPMRGGRGGRGGPRARRGDIRSAVLGLLAETPTNGYGLIRAIGERTGDAWRPSPGSIYPTLAQLVDEGLLTQTEGPRGPYSLTDAGQEYVSAHAEEIDGAFSHARSGESDDDLGTALRKLLMATAPFRAGVTPEQKAAAVAAVDTARRELHRILAE